MNQSKTLRILNRLIWIVCVAGAAGIMAAGILDFVHQMTARVP